MKKLIIFSAIALMFASCKKEFDLNLDSENKSYLVVEGMITDQDEAQTVRLTRTVNYLKPVKPESVGNAIVTVTVDGKTTLSYTYTKDGLYVAPSGFKGVVGSTYALKIMVDETLYEASTKMNKPLVLDEATTKRDEFNKDKFEIRLSFIDNPEKGDYVLFKYSRNGQLVDTLTRWSRYNDILTNGLKFIDTRAIGDVEGKVGDDITVYSYSISKPYYEFLQAAEQSTFEPVPFFPPPGAAITGNITNGALGFFQASAIKKVSTKLKE